MKAIISALGLAALLGLTACETSHRHAHQGGVYAEDYDVDYGHGASNQSMPQYYRPSPFEGYPNLGRY